MAAVRNSREPHKGRQDLTRFLRTENSDIEITSYKVKDLGREYIELLTDLNQACFPPCTREDCRSDITERSNIVHVAAYKGTGLPVGLAGEMTVMEGGQKCAYLSFAAVAESERGKGVYQQLAYARIMNAVSRGIMLVRVDTQNANIEYGIRKILDKIVSEGHIGGYEISRQIEPGRMQHYGVGRVAGDAPVKSKSDQLNREYEVLDVDRGDGFNITIRLATKKS